MPRKSSRAVYLSLSYAIYAALFCYVSPARAEFTQLYEISQRGDMILIGNTLGYDCRAGIPRPIVGNVGSCGTRDIDDSSADVFWSSETPGAGMATASDAILPTEARSSALLNLPPGSQVTYARLFWGATLREDPPTNSTVTLERPKGFSTQLTALPGDLRFEIGGSGYVYQGSANVTDIIKRYGSGVYRLSQVPRYQIADRDQDVNFAVWSLVVIYKNNHDPFRQFKLWSGFDTVQLNDSVDFVNTSLRVATAGPMEGRLAIIAYEGDHDKLGDNLKINGTKLFDAQNPVDNFFNNTRSTLGMPISIVGDLPQLDGTPGSMSGLELDIVRIDSYLSPGDFAVTLRAESNLDVYFLGGAATAVRSTECSRNEDCQLGPPGRSVCAISLGECVECASDASAACSPQGNGAICIAAESRCGCNNDSDCGGRTCNTETHRCPPPVADLALSADCVPSAWESGLTLSCHATVRQAGPAPVGPPIQLVSTRLSPGWRLAKLGDGGNWRCNSPGEPAQIYCESPLSLAPGAELPPLDIEVQLPLLSWIRPGAADSQRLELELSVRADTVQDPHPENNSVRLMHDLDEVKGVARYGCAVTGLRAERNRAPWSSLLSGVLLLMLGLRLRSRIAGSGSRRRDA